jgi:hypothetical protein
VRDPGLNPVEVIDSPRATHVRYRNRPLIRAPQKQGFGVYLGASCDSPFESDDQADSLDQTVSLLSAHSETREARSRMPVRSRMRAGRPTGHRALDAGGAARKSSVALTVDFSLLTGEKLDTGRCPDESNRGD